jgi:hypothetical protein
VASGGAGGAYVPQLGLHLAPEALTGSAAQDPVNEYLDNEGDAEPTGTRSFTLPGAIEPLPVNAQAAKEFYEKHPYDPSPVNTPGAGGDPWEVLTGAQALALAKVFYLESIAFSGKAALCNRAGFAACAAQDEVLAVFYGLASEKLMACYEAVHNGRYNSYHTFENGVCWISWYHTEGGDPTDLSVESCWSGSGAFGRYGLNEWDCRGHGWHGLRKLDL